jgi:hypothetical protein
MLFWNNETMEMTADIGVEVYVLKSNNCGY